MLISCEQCQDRLGDVLDASPEASRAAGLDGLLNHVATCPACARDLALMRAARMELRGLPVLAPPANLRARVLAQLTPATTGVATAGGFSAGVAATNGAYGSAAHETASPAPRTTPPARPGFIETLSRWWRTPTARAWAPGLALGGVCLALLVRAELPQPILHGDTNSDAAVRGTDMTAPAPAPTVPARSGDKSVPQATGARPTAGQPGAVTGPATHSHPAPAQPRGDTQEPSTAASVTTPTKHVSHDSSARHHSATVGSSKPEGASVPAMTHHGESHVIGQSPVTPGSAHATAAATVAAPPPGAHGPRIVPRSATSALANPRNNMVVAKPTPRAEVQQPGGTHPFATLTLASSGPSKVRSHGPEQPVVQPGSVPAGPSGPAGQGPDAGGTGTPPNPAATQGSAPGAPGGHDATNTGSDVSDNALQFGHAGDARTARLLVWPPAALDSAQISVGLSPGMSFADNPVGGGERTMWHGAAKPDEPIKITLDLTALAPGVQTIDVTLAKVGADAAGPAPVYEVVQHQKLSVNVAAR